MRDYEVLEFGEAETAVERTVAIDTAQRCSNRKRPLVVVMETWEPRWHGSSGFLVGTVTGRWLEVLEIAGHSLDLIELINPTDWRQPTFRGTALDATSIVAQDYSIATANDQIANAILIAQWSSSAEVVRAMLPKVKKPSRRRRWIPKVYESEG